MTIIIFLIVLGVLIFVHELGHFLLAKWNGIRVDAFKIGFGPKMIAWKMGETEYGINWIPFGGFVRIHGENPDEDSMNGPDKERSFVNKNRCRQASVLVAGVLFNFLFACLIYIVVFNMGVTATMDGFEKYSSDFSNFRIMITEVSAGSPAEAVGLKLGDVITDIYQNDASSTANKLHVLPLTVSNIQSAIASSSGKVIDLGFTRGRNMKVVEIVPKPGIIPGKYDIGIAMQDVGDMKLPFSTSIFEGGRYTLIMIEDTVSGLYMFILNIFQGTANFSDVTGPVGIAGVVGNAADLGITYLLMVTALISVNLGVINLIPFPALDGGRLLFVIIEGITRRKVPVKFFNIVNIVGFVILMVLMVIVTYNDISSLMK